MDASKLKNQKPFNPAIYSEYDAKAKAALLNYLINYKKLKAIEPPNVFDVDLILEDRAVGYEIEAVLNWTGPKFPYPIRNIPFRKYKYWNNHPLENYYVFFNKDCTKFYWMSPSKMKQWIQNKNLSNQFVCNNNGEERSFECFYQIPIEEFNLIDLNLL